MSKLYKIKQLGAYPPDVVSGWLFSLYNPLVAGDIAAKLQQKINIIIFGDKQLTSYNSDIEI